MNISQIIIPAAGMGTRFLPITKTIPKELLPLGNKPAIQYIVQEAHDAGIHNQHIILCAGKEMIKHYFSASYALEQKLAQDNKLHLLDSVNNLIDDNTFTYHYQSQPAGLAHALSCAKESLNKDNFFAVALPDDIIVHHTPELKLMASLASLKKAMVIALQEVPNHMTSAYGIAKLSKKNDSNDILIESFVEKPSPGTAPSNYAIVGRYIFHPDLFSYIEKTPPNKEEVLLPETINLMIQAGYQVYGHVIQGKRYDTGTPAGWAEYIKQEGI